MAATKDVVGVAREEPDGLRAATFRTIGGLSWFYDDLEGSAVNGDHRVGATGETVHVVWDDARADVHEAAIAALSAGGFGRATLPA